jgi:multiple sugar transport system substrate-binding protein
MVRYRRAGRRRAWAAIAAIAAMALVLTACGGDTDDTDVGAPDEPGTDTEETEDPDEAGVDDEGAQPEGTLRFANWQWLEEGRGDDLWAAVTAYEDDNPNATLEQEATPFGDYADTLNTQMGGGVGPDIFIVLDNQWVVLEDAGLLEPLDDVVGDADLNASNEAMVIDGQMYGVTWEQVTYALLGNQNVMDEAGIDELPTTVDELIEAAEQVQAETDADGFAVRHRIAEFAGWSADFPNWTYGFGGQWSDGGELTIDADENVEAVSEFQRVYDSGVMPVGDDASTFRNKFKENSLGFIIDNSGAGLSFTSGGQITGQDMVSGPLPFPEGAGAHQKLILAVNANSENVDLAKDFVRWFVSEEGQTLIRPPLGASTLATDVPLPDEFVEEHPWAETYVELGQQSRSLLIEGHELETMDYYQTIMEAVERVVTEGQDPREALEQVQQQLQ